MHKCARSQRLAEDIGRLHMHAETPIINPNEATKLYKDGGFPSIATDVPNQAQIKGKDRNVAGGQPSELTMAVSWIDDR